jgi:hypothetical protein
MKLLLALTLSLAAAICADSVNFAGRWSIQNPGRGGGSFTILNLNQVAGKVTGTVTPPRIDSGTSAPVNTEIFEGKAEGASLTFYVWGGTDEPVKVVYKGTLTGDEIKFTVTGMPAPMGLNGPQPGGGAPREMIAKRMK